MNQRLLLSLLILSVGLIVFFTGHVLPQVSSGMMILIFLALYTWLMTMAMVHNKRLAKKFPVPVNSEFAPRVTVVIAAHNEEFVIAKTVKTMLAIDYPDFEVLVMDDRSTDNTPVILRKLHDELNNPKFRYHSRDPQSTPGKSAVLNEALTMSDGSVICVFDADASVEPDFLTNIVPFLADENVGAVQARKVISNAHTNWLTRCQNYEYSVDAHYQFGRGSVYGAVELRGNGQLVKRMALADVNGWNENTVTDDLDLSTRLHLSGWDIRFAHKVSVYEEGITSFKPLMRQRLRWSEGMLMRYLEYAGDILTSRKISLRTVFDMMSYVIQFLLPLWVMFDLMNLVFLSITGDPSRLRIMSSLFAVPIFIFCTMIALVVAIIRFNHRQEGKIRPLEAWGWSVVTGLYLLAVWYPITFAMMGKVLFGNNKQLHWERTEHFGEETPAT